MAILAQLFSKSLILADYTLNKEKITRAYCENKAKPKMHCDGKCHLKKQLKKEEKREKSPLSNKEQNEIFYCHEFSFALQKPVAELKEKSFTYHFHLKTSAPGAIFQPPKC